jgi:hypothetical protein
MITRRSILRAGGLITALGVAGCSGDSKSGIDESAAEERALSDETEYVETRLQNATCLESWGIGEYTMEATATVTDRTEEGVRVEVQRPYSYSTTEQIADVATHATYLVAENQTERLSGDSVGPC